MSGRRPDMWRQSQCCGGARDEIVQVDLFGLLAVFWLVVTFRTLVGAHTGQAWVR